MMRSTSGRVLAVMAVAAVPLAVPAAGWAAAPGDTEVAWTTYQASLDPVTANHVTGQGKAMVQLSGNTAKITVTASGLVGGKSPHAMHIHVDGGGVCPKPSEAVDHNGHPSINVADAMKDYGMIGTSLTTSGDTTDKSALAVDRFPAGSTVSYHRTVEVSDGVAANLKSGKAVLVVHGIDYNGNGMYDSVLGASELDKSLPAEATDPALCGAFTASQMSSMPSGGADTGDGATQAGRSGTGMVAGGSAAVLVGLGAGGFALRRRGTAGR
ncbi:hypothetical protein [Streptomyces sp. NBC_01477]|uniref:hypothetical protein n=1 Tax=Streptomyces sp. NBC_01477 TaxID=2976015 RepID=UPI002E2EDE8D|nr:hypothetical protein [Streptomyces sp. NBC_01477]